jgi:hypothetical protein
LCPQGVGGTQRAHGHAYARLDSPSRLIEPRKAMTELLPT